MITRSLTAMLTAVLLVLFAIMAIAKDKDDKEKKKPPKKEDKTLVLEIESFKLTNAKVEPMKEAGGKKVVRFECRKGKAEMTLSLASGWYDAVLYVRAENDESKSTRLLIEAEDYMAGVADLPVSPWDKKKIAPCSPSTFGIQDSKKKRKIVIRPDDLGVQIDRLEIKRRGR